MNLTLLSRWNRFECLCILRSNINRKVLFALKWDWFHIFVCYWNIVLVIYFYWMCWLVCYYFFAYGFLCQDLSESFWDLFYRNVSVFSKFNLLQIILICKSDCFWRNNLFLLSLFYWYVSDSININSMCRLLRSIIFIVDFNYRIGGWNYLFNWFKFLSFFFRDYINWNVCNVSEIKCFNKSFFCWFYFFQLWNIFFWSFVNRDIFNTIECNWSYNNVGYWYEAYIVYFYLMGSNVRDFFFLFDHILFEKGSVYFWYWALR